MITKVTKSKSRPTAYTRAEFASGLTVAFQEDQARGWVEVKLTHPLHAVSLTMTREDLGDLAYKMLEFQAEMAA